MLEILTLLQAATAAIPPTLTSHIGEAIITIAVGIKTYMDRRSAKESGETLAALERGIQEELTTLRHHLIGPDGANGIRGDVRELKAKMEEFERRERERLERQVGTYNRRAGE